MGGLRIKKGDLVVVRSGKYKGQRGAVLRCFPKLGMVLVDGINQVLTSKVDPARGERIVKHLPLHVCKVALLVGGAPTKVGYRMDDSGVKVRFAKRSGETI